MAKFSTDADILRYEPILFSELHLPWQVLTSGSGGSLSDTTFTVSGEDFVSSQISAGCTIYLQSLDGTLDGVFEIVSVDSATQLTVSVIRANDNDNAISPPAATELSYRVSTFSPQATEVGFQLTEYFGIKPGNPASDIESDDILDKAVLKQASVFAVLSNVYTMLASQAEDENFWKKSLHYRKEFEKARSRSRVSIDSDSDGVSDSTRLGGSVRMVRD